MGFSCRLTPGPAKSLNKDFSTRCVISLNKTVIYLHSSLCSETIVATHTHTRRTVHTFGPGALLSLYHIQLLYWILLYYWMKAYYCHFSFTGGKWPMVKKKSPFSINFFSQNLLLFSPEKWENKADKQFRQMLRQSGARLNPGCLFRSAFHQQRRGERGSDLWRSRPAVGRPLFWTLWGSSFQKHKICWRLLTNWNITCYSYAFPYVSNSITHELEKASHWRDSLHQRCQTCGSWAKSDQLRCLILFWK